ncbi:retrovirus-related pol polyprotein from transposon TNT 1-94 [Tanacetum coccineum]
MLLTIRKPNQERFVSAQAAELQGTPRVWRRKEAEKGALSLSALSNRLLTSKAIRGEKKAKLIISPIQRFSFPIQDRETKQVIAQGLCEDGLYVLRDTPMALAATVGVSRKASFELWHNRLGHVSFDVISTLNKLGVLDVTSILPKPNICKPCQLSKSQRLPFELNSKRSSYPLDLIHCDLWGPAPVSSDGYLYYVIFVDDYSRFTWFYPLKTKSGFYTVLSAFIKLVQTQLSRKIKVFQSDGGTEFVNHTVRKIFEDNGTLHRLSCPYTPQQNGRAERKHRHLVETGLAMLFHAHVPASYWVDAFSSATYIINRLPTKLLGNHSPFELLYSRLPNYTNFRAFGCLVYPYLRDYSAHKLAPRSIPCVFIGYNPQYKGYKCLDPDSSRIYITRHARFDEVTFPFASTANPNALSTLQLCTFLEDGPPISDAPVPESRPTDTRPSSSSPCGLCPVPTTAAEPIHEPDSTPSSPYSSEDDNPPTDSDDVSSHGAPPAPPATAPTEPSSVHQMKTRSKSGIFKTKHSPDFVSLTSHALHAALFSLVQPKGFKSAAKHPQWMAAMHDEMEALKQNCTWTLVPRPSASNIVGSKWVYRIKYHADGSVERFKARVVAQGFTQIPGLDYSHTFSPVVKASTVRIVLSLAVLHRWRLHQLDVKNAFLHGHLNETVYMEQPPGFIDPQFPNHVCKLSKALYGLKQAPRAWFHRLSSFLLAHGFVCSRADTSLFVFTKDSCIMYLLVYVDDLILTGNNESLLTSFTTRLNQEFAIKDLGDLSYFLGLEVSYTNDGLFLSQAKYATDVLTRAALLDSKPVSTPLAANEVFVTGGSLFANPTLYRSLVGALQYLTITRPDLSYAVNQASQFLHAPTDAHFQSVKRILRYVKGTITYGLIFRRPHSNSILGYSDADWARCIETRRSTYGYSIFLGGNLVSWSAKKQPTVSRSSCESEYRAMANTAAEIIWITHLLRELHALPPDRPTLLCDNKSALFMSQNPVSHKRAKHIDLDYHFVRELVASGKLYTKFIPTKLQVADIFTKSLPRPQFEYFRSLLRLGPPPIRLRGDIR